MYLGRSLTSGNYLKLDDISSQFNGTTRTFNLTSGGNLFYPGSAFSILVSLGGVIQEPESAYTINEYQITFASAPQALDDFFCIVLGVSLGVGVPADGSVTLAKLASNARGVGIESGGVAIGAGVTQLNFIGTGNTFSYNPTTNTVDISIQGQSSSGGVGIQSGGVAIGVGVTQLNFIGTGNTFFYNPSTNTVDISIQGGGGATGAGGTFSANSVGVHTTKILGINTTTIVGAANSEGALQAVGNVALVDGALLTNQVINQTVYVPSDKNALLIGPVTVGAGVTIDVAPGSTLVIV